MKKLAAFLFSLFLALPSGAIYPEGSGDGSTVHGINSAGIGNESTIHALFNLMKTGSLAIPSLPTYFFSADAGNRGPLGVDTNPGTPSAPLLSISRLNDLISRGRGIAYMDCDSWVDAGDWGGATRILMGDRTSCADPHGVCFAILPWCGPDVTNDANRWTLDCTNIAAVGSAGIITDARTTRTGAFHVEGYQIQNCETAEVADMDHIRDTGPGAFGAQIVSVNGRSLGLFGNSANAVTFHAAGSQSNTINLKADTAAGCCAVAGNTSGIGFQQGGHLYVNQFPIQSSSTVITGPDTAFHIAGGGASAVLKAFLYGMRFVEATANVNVFPLRVAVSGGANTNNDHEVAIANSYLGGHASASGLVSGSTSAGQSTRFNSYKSGFVGNVNGIDLDNQIATAPASGYLFEWRGTCDYWDNNSTANWNQGAADGASGVAKTYLSQVNMGHDDSDASGNEWVLGPNSYATVVAARADPNAVWAPSFGTDAARVNFAGVTEHLTPATGACNQTSCQSTCTTPWGYTFPTAASGGYWGFEHLLGREIKGFSFNEDLKDNLGR